jgi:aryl-alcohol dehydrogenase-like predicted oxidoreductase
MSYGGGNLGNHAWSLPEAESQPFIKKAIEAGINFFDTANRYSLGSSEEILGRAIKDFARRDEVVIATKVYGRMRAGPNGAGLSRKAIFAEIDNSLRRLGMDYVDLYQIHRFDHDTPIEETLEALHGVVKAGKARYIGASSMHAWQFGRALGIAEKNGWTRFVSMRNLVNLLYREEEREMLPLCEAEGIGVIPWPAGARQIEPRLGLHQHPHRDRRRDHSALRQDTGGRQEGCRSRGRSRQCTRHPTRPGSACLAPGKAGHYRTDRRRHQAPPPRRRACIG